MIIPAWVAVSVVVFISGDSVVYSSAEVYKTKDLCEAVQAKVMKVAAESSDILAIGTKCTEIQVNDDFPRNEKPKTKELPKIGT
jgi:hypothetical protein